MSDEERLIKCLIDTPELFTDREFSELVKPDGFLVKDLRPVLKKIFEIDDKEALNKSAANRGILGILNRLSRFLRGLNYRLKIKKGGFSKKILAEGDSWFEYPFFIDDIFDHLDKCEKKYAINSIASGGDWMANILYEKEYLERLYKVKPDVFLISAGGNDIVDDSRLKHLTHKRNTLNLPNEVSLETDVQKREFADRCLNKNFFALLKLFEHQYNFLFQSIEQDTENFNNLRIITQGYDYSIPSTALGHQFIRYITNYFYNGRWLKLPLTENGYTDKNEQRAIIRRMIDLFNDILIKVGSGYKNVYHVDCRNAVDPANGWYNELHPTSGEFKKIANVFEICIEAGNQSGKVFKVNAKPV